MSSSAATRLVRTAALAGIAAVAAVPVLPSGADVYAHLLWTHQAMRCLAAGQLPLWAPDLNAGFGSPGIRLYSPAGPVAAALLGLPAGDAALGLRAALLLAAGALVLVARRRAGGWAAAGVVLAGTPFLADLGVRAAWGQMLALPLELALLEAAVTDRRRWRRDAVLLAVLWLVHAPSAVMTVTLLFLAAAVRPHPWRPLVGWGRVAAAAGCLTAWHWLPLAQELRLTGAHAGLTGGIFAAAQNWLGSPAAHAPRLNAALSAAAVAMGILGVAALRRLPLPERRVRLVLLAACLALAGPTIVPLLRLGLPLDWLQFPWRWLTPAALILAGPLAAHLRHRPGWVAVWLAPALLLPWEAPLRAPHLGPGDGWPEIGAAVAAFGGNPLAVDVVEHRPPWHRDLAAELARFGPAGRAVADPPARLEITEWSPLERRIRVVAPVRCVVRIRLLRYPGWEITVDGRPAAPLRDGAAMAVAVPPGRHVAACRWRGNPLAGLGSGVALAAVAVLAVARRRPAARRARGPAPRGT